MMDEMMAELAALRKSVDYLLTLEQGNAPMPYGAYDSTGNAAIAAAATLNLDTENMLHPNYTLAASEITVAATGRYVLWAKIIYDITDQAGGATGSVDAWLEEDSGGWAEIVASRGRTFHNESSGGSGVVAFAPVSLGAGDAVRVRRERINGTTNIDTAAGYSSLFILRIG